jgi:hypothetical protein
MMHEWISVEVSMPDDDRNVLCYVQKFGTRAGWVDIMYYEGGEWWTENDDRPFEQNPDYYIVTHWCDYDTPDWKRNNFKLLE